MVSTDTLFGAIFMRDVSGAARSGGAWFHGLFFFAIFVGFVAFSLGPDRTTLQPISSALVWLAAALSIQLATTDMFQQDDQDGTIRIIASEEQDLSIYVAARTITTWLTSVLPVSFASPIFLIMLGATFEQAIQTAAVLVIGSVALVLAGLLAGSLSTGLKVNNFFSTFLSAPLVIPILIFGVGASPADPEVALFIQPEFLILTALTLLLIVTAPLFAIWSLRLTLE